MNFRYRSYQITEIVKAAKIVREGQSLKFKSYGEKSGVLDLDLDLKDGSLLDLRLHITAGRYDEPATYEASLTLADQQVRGSGHSHTKRARFYRTRIPRGWHENVIDPNLPTGHDNYNRHESLAAFELLDLVDFLRKVSERWNIELPKPSRELL